MRCRIKSERNSIPLTHSTGKRYKIQYKSVRNVRFIIAIDLRICVQSEHICASLISCSRIIAMLLLLLCAVMFLLSNHPFLYYVRVSKEENITMTRARERWVGGWWWLLVLVRIILYEFIHNYIIVVGATMRVFLLSAMCRWVFELNAVLFLSPSTTSSSSSSSFITSLYYHEMNASI